MTFKNYITLLGWAIVNGVASSVATMFGGKMLGSDFTWKQLGIAALSAAIFSAANHLRTPPTSTGGGNTGGTGSGTSAGGGARMGGTLGGFRPGLSMALCGLLLLIPLLPATSCARRNPGESDAAFKLRQRAVLLGTVAVSLEALSDGTAVLVDAGAIPAKSGIEILEYDSEAARAWQQLRPLLDGTQPLPPDLAGRFNAILTLLEKLQREGLLRIQNPQAKEWFDFSVELARTSITAVQAFTTRGAVPQPVMMDMARLKNRKDTFSDPDAPVPSWVLALIRTAIIAEGKIHNLNLFPTAAEVWEYSGALVQHTIEANATRVGGWRAKI